VKDRGCVNMKLKEVIELLQKEYSEDEELHIAMINDYKSILISKRFVESFKVNWR
jgi:hypothetical protein